MKTKDIPGYEGKYYASEDGDIFCHERKQFLHRNNCWALRKGKRLSPSLIKGYPGIHLVKDGVNKTFTIHRLIAITFIPNPKNLPQVNHINGIKTDNRVKNLEWVTNSENIKHAYRTGLLSSEDKKGSKHFNSKLSESQVLDIRKMLSEGIKQSKIARQFRIDPSTISYIKTGRLWKHV